MITFWMHELETERPITWSNVFRLASLLAKFRIQYSDLIVITDIMTKAKDSTREFFEGLIREYRKTNDGILDDGKCETDNDRRNHYLFILFDNSKK